MKSRLFTSIFHILILTGLMLFISQPTTSALATANSAPLMTVNAWSALGSGISNGSVLAIANYGTDIYVAGSFTDAGGNTSADRIAKWDGSSWSALGSGISNGQVNSLVFHGSNLYVGGTFTDAGGNTAADYIAQWDGSTWSTLGNGLNNPVIALAVSGSNIYAAGDFTDAGGNGNADFIAKLDGGAWESLGSTPLNGSVFAIASTGADVFAGGVFFNAGGDSSADLIAHWDGTSWSAMDTGMNNEVNVIALNGGNVYAGGYFINAIAQWDGTSWSNLGTGLNAHVDTIATSGSNLYAGGGFINGGGDAIADYIARWDGSTWSALGATPLNNNVSAILVNGVDVYAGGTFTDAGGDGNADRIALFQIDATLPTVNSFTATSPTNSLNIPITAFTASDNIGVTGYKITENNTPPAANAAGWTASAPSTYTVASSGSYTLYPWVKDVSGNVSAVYGSPATVTVDASAPTVTSFSAQASVTSLTVPITAFTASDNVDVTGYKITESSTPPSAGAAGWTASAPSDYTLSSYGNYTLYPWAKDALGNVSAVYGSPASVTACLPGTITVTSNADSGAGTLRKALADACAGNTINFNASLSGATIRINSTLTLSKDVTIDGSSLALQVTISGDSDNDGNGNVRIFDVEPGTTVVMNSLTLTKGLSLTQAGAIHNAGTLTILNSTISANRANNSAGAIHNDGGASVLNITDSTISGNTAVSSGGHGGAIWNQTGTLTITNSTFSGNTTTLSADGGAIYQSNGGTITITSSTFSGNSAARSGGGIFITTLGTVTITNSTVSGNSAKQDGGGLYSGGGTINVNYSTIASNTSDSDDSTVGDGGGIRAGTINLQNSIVAGNKKGVSDSSADNCSGTITSQGYNLTSCSLAGTGDITVSPFSVFTTVLNSSLANNGGPTQTHALLSGSPAINAGDDATCAAAPVSGLDQRGVTRPQVTHCDIGAYEYVDTVAPTVTAFTIPSSVTSLTVPITTFTASDNVTLAAYLVTESSTPPSAGAAGWVASTPTEYTLSSYGSYTLYPWAKDAAGNVSAVYGSPAAVTACSLGPITVTNNANNGAGSLRQAISDACADETINFDSGLSGGTIYLASTLTLSKNVTIDGSALASQITISGDSDNNGTGDVGVFSVNSGVITTLDSLTITKGQASSGGGILNQGTLTVMNSTFSANTTTSAGGGIFNNGVVGGSLTVANSTFIGNSASTYGGGIFNDAGEATVTNSTFSGNSAISGGGIYQLGGGTLTIKNSTLSGNFAGSGGGLYIDGNPSGALLYYNTIIANSTSGGDCIGNGRILINTRNLVEDGTCSAFLSGDPNLGSLASNGGPTQTFALLAGSPAIDAANNVICVTSPVSGLDQRGFSRPQGSACDIGAYEYNHPPVVSSIVRTGASPTNAASVNFTVTFSESVTGVDSTDFNLTTSGITGASVSGVTGSGTTRTVSVNTGSGEGTLRLDVLDDDSIQDSLGDSLNGGFTSGQSYTVDHIIPSVSSSMRANTSPTNATSVNFTVTFSESVTGVDVTDFSLNTTGISGASITGVSGSGADYTVSVSTGSSSGTLRLDVLDDDSIVDTAGNALAGTLTSGESYTIDKTAPTIVSSLIAGVTPITNASSVAFNVTFSESVTGVDAADFSLTTTGVTGASVSGVTGSGATYTVSVNTGSGNGTIRLDLPVSATVTDTVGNSLSGIPYTSGEAYTITKTVTVTIMSTNTQDGWVLESSETSNKGSTLNSTLTTFRLGDDATKKQYRGILSFNTATIPDTAVITAVTLKVKRQGVTGGGNPLSIFQGFMVDIKKGLFGAANLQAADFQTTASKTYGPFSPSLASNWYSINLTTGKAYINKLSTSGGLTQIRLRFKLDDNGNALANYLSLYSGNAPAGSRPQLVITYNVP